MCGTTKGYLPKFYPTMRFNRQETKTNYTMKRFLLLTVLLCAFALPSCETSDGIQEEIDAITEQVIALENSVASINSDIVALHKLLDESLRIVGVTQHDTYYVIEFSDGSNIHITLGEKIPALVPLMNIDEDGYWIYSLDGGTTYNRLLQNGEPVSAWAIYDEQHQEQAVGITPQLKIDTNGYWLVSYDGGSTYESLLINGNKVNAFGGSVSVSFSIFKNVVYDTDADTLTVTMTDGSSYTLKVEDTFSLQIVAEGVQRFFLGEKREFEVKMTGVEDVVIRPIDGWEVVMEQSAIYITAPATFVAESQNVTLQIVIYSEKNFRKVVSLPLVLLNETLDGTACNAWRNFKSNSDKNVLLDFSYAGYDHGLTAPKDGYEWGYKVYNVVDYGADPTGTKSSREAFISLLNELKLTGSNRTPNARAVIYFPEGRFILHNDDDNIDDPSSTNKTELDSKGNNTSNAIFIYGGNFVIKGAGRDKTTLVMDTPNLPASSDLWSSPVMINIKHNSSMTSDGNLLTSVVSDSPKGSFSVDVATTTGIGVGDWICLYLKNNDAELVAQELAPHTIDNAQMTNIQTITVTDYHQVKSINGSTITFHEPLMHAVESKWGWEIRKYPHYENVGIEDLTFEGHAKENFGHHDTWQDDGAYKPLNMMRLTNSWIRRVDFHSVSEAVSIAQSANCSAYDIEITGNRGHSAVRSQASSRIFIGKVYDHSRGYALTNSSGTAHGEMMENAGQYHASGVSESAMGTVLWNNSWGEDALFEAHSRQPRATLVDNCTGGFVQWRFGGDENAVPNHLDDLTLWNMNATRVKHDFGSAGFKWWLTTDRWWKTMPPTIVGFHGGSVTFDESPEQIKYLESNGTAVQPESLYEAQLRERLGYIPAWLNALK